MTILEHPKAQALLGDAMLTTEQVAQIGLRIEPFLKRYNPLFKRSEQRTNARLLLEGKLSALSRKTAEPIAHQAKVRREVLQDFLGISPWSDDLVLDELRRHVRDAWNDPRGVLLGDGSSFPKKGIHSCGVKRQYCGRLGKVDNSQLGIFLGYACRHGHTLIDHRLFLPKEWCDDRERRKKTGVPEEVVYQESWEILLSQVDRCKDVPHAWVVADAEFGRVYAFRKGLRERQERYVVDVRNDMQIRDLRATPPQRHGQPGRPPLPPWQSVQAWAACQSPASWTRISIRAGENGPLLVEAAQTRVQTRDDRKPGAEERLVVIRTVEAAEPKTWYTFSNADDETPLVEVVWAHAQRYWEESSFREGKGEVGLDEYEVRGWRGWHHHMTVSLLALWFLSLERFEQQRVTPALTVSVLREVFTRVLALGRLTLATIVEELNATLRRTEESRIYAWVKRTGSYPPRRTEWDDARVVTEVGKAAPSPRLSGVA